MSRRSAGAVPAKPPRTYPFEPMLEQPYALDRLEVQFRWGRYLIRLMKFHYTTFPPGRVIPFHKHSEFEFHLIPRGSGIVILEETLFQLDEGMVYVTGPGVLHYQEASESEAMDELCLHIDIYKLEQVDGYVESWEEAEAEACIRQLEQLPLRPELDRHQAMSCFLAAYLAWRDNDPALLTQMKHAVIQIMLRTARAFTRKQAAAAELPSRDMKRHRYELAVQFIKDNYNTPLTLELVAERVQISARQLQRIFRNETGSTFTEYVESVRLQQVCKELADPARTIESIAAENGYSSASYLHFVFKRKLGMTPMQFRLAQSGTLPIH